MKARCMILAVTLLPAASVAEDRDIVCESLSNELIDQMSVPPLNRDYRLYSVDAFYSDSLDACIHVEAKLFGPEIFVRDLTRTVIKDETARFPPVLLHCDVLGVDEANIDAVRQLRGIVADIPYENWLTDGQGGLPRALETSDRPLDRAECESALIRWLASWAQ